MVVVERTDNNPILRLPLQTTTSPFSNSNSNLELKFRLHRNLEDNCLLIVQDLCVFGIICGYE